MKMKMGIATTVAVWVFSAGLSAQDRGQVEVTGNGRVSYAGEDLRLGIGLDHDGDIHGEYFHVFGEDENSNWVAELWASDQRGGIKLNYHWLHGADNLEDARSAQDDVSIRKVFLALDQNQFDDRKVTLGIGAEKRAFFWGGYLMHATTGARLLGESIQTTTEVLAGVEGNREFVQDRITDLITRSFEHPYDYGVGLRIGRYYEPQLLRLRGGLDYEKGDFGTDQFALSLGVEKFFADSPHSLALTTEYVDKSGPLEVDDDDLRAVLLYRYNFGNSFQPRQDYIEREVTDTVAARPAVMDKRLVQNRIDIQREALFDFDRAVIRPDSDGLIRALWSRLQTMDLASPIHISGHTCDIGPDAYNQRLSDRRANAVADLLAALGLERSAMVVGGEGERNPKYPNDSEDNRRKNRRVAIEFVTVEESSEAFEVNSAMPGKSEVRWVREPIDDPAWLYRALRNPVQHKRSVDTYRFQTQETRVTTGNPVFVNTLPVANDDTAQTLQERPVNIGVLANDQDDDGDTLTILDVTQGANGAVVIESDQTVTYTPVAGFFGNDTFNYTIADANQAQSSATVSVTVSERPPLVANDDRFTSERGEPVPLLVLENDVLPGTVIVQFGTPANGTLTNRGDVVLYNPISGFIGDDVFGYTISDEFGRQAQANVTVTVTAANQAPVAVDDTATTSKNTSVVIDVLANDFDPDGDPLTIVQIPDHSPMGTLELTDDNKIIYHPMPGWWGGDEFSYTISDPFGAQATARVVLDVTR